MNLDVAIFSGGKATRLRGLWDKSKFFVPVGGVPLIDRIFERIRELAPRAVYLLLDRTHATEILRHVVTRRRYGLDVVPINEGEPIGTAGALRRLLWMMGDFDSAPLERYPLMVLNHDTLQLYQLTALAEYHEQRHGAWATAAFVHRAESWRDVYAGASVLSVEAQREIYADERTHDFPVHLLGAHRFNVPGFLDVGTPEGFQRAKEWRDG